MRKLSCGLVLVLFLIAVQSLRADGLRVATFSVDITPPLGQPVGQGFIPILKTAEHPLLARGVLLRDEDEACVLCTLDLMEVHNESYDFLRERIGKAAGVPASHVALHSLHQHTAPCIDTAAQRIEFNETHPRRVATAEYLLSIAEKLTPAIREARKRWKPVTHIATGKAKADRVASNRRIEKADGSIQVRGSNTKSAPELRELEEGLIDPWVRSVSLENSDGPLIQLHFYGSHPQSFYGDGRASYDVPGIIRKNLEDKSGIFQIYVTGCGGDVAFGKYNDGSREARTQLTSRLQSGIEASLAARTRHSIGPLAWSIQQVQFPLRTDAAFGEKANRKILADENSSDAQRRKAAIALAWIARVRSGRPVELSCLTLGPVKLLHLPGEPFVQFQLAAQKMRSDCFVCVAGYGDCGMGYIGGDRIYTDRGGYEQTYAFAGPSEELMLGAMKSLLGQADGEAQSPSPVDFQEHLIAGGFTYSFGIQTADLDGDGDLDITAADALPNNSLYWFENDGSGTFSKHLIQKNDPERLERHAIGDVDGDGWPDVVIVKNLFGDVLWFRNSGTSKDGQLWKRHEITKGKLKGAYDVALADFDGDGDLDVAASSWRLSNNFVWFENDGSPADGKWTMRLIEADVAETRMIRAADIDGDGDADLVGAAREEPVICWYENSGDPAKTGWKKHIIDGDSVQPIHGEPVDFDQDGDIDLVMALGMGFSGDPDAEQLAWYENDGTRKTGAWKKHLIENGLTGAFEAVTGDFDGDGDLDIVLTIWNGAGAVLWFENPGKSKSAWKKHIVKQPWRRANQVITGDFDGDGRLDLAAGAERGSNEVRWWRNIDATGPRRYTVRRTPSPIKIDGRLDEDAWKKAQTFGRFEFPWWKEGRKEQTVARMLWDDEFLYVAYDCRDAHVSATRTERDSQVYKDDCVELFTAPNPKRPHEYFNIEMNVNRAILDRHHPKGPGKPQTPNWNAKGIRIATTVDGTLNDDSDTDRGWVLEVAIPFSNFQVTTGKPYPDVGDVWHLNLNRLGGETNPQHSQWSPGTTPKPAFHTPDTFGRVTFSACE